MNNPAPSSSAKAPLVFGIVGHRDPLAEDVAKLQQALADLIESFRKTYPHTPVVVLSALAEGADQLAAEVAQQLHCELRTPLPFEPEVYAQSTSFDTAEGKQRLQQFVADQSVVTFAVPGATSPVPASRQEWLHVASDKDEDAKRRRHECYAAAGCYITRHCHVLVAFWDGSDPDPNRPSGTAEHIFFKLLGRPPRHFRDALSSPLGFHGESGPVVVIHTPRRQGSSAPQKAAAAVQVLVPAGAYKYSAVPAGVPLARRLQPAERFLDRCSHSIGGPIAEDDDAHVHASPASPTWLKDYHPSVVKEFQQAFQALDDFNADVERADPYEPDKLAKIRLSSGASPLLKAWLDRLNRIRRAASCRSSDLQTPLEGDEAGTFGLLFIALVAFDLYAHVFCIEPGQTRHWPILLAVFAGMIAMAVVTVARSWWLRNEARRLDYRAFAEALRVRVAWGLAGIGRSVADSYLSQLRSELSWTRTALLHVSPPPGFWSQEFDRLSPSEKQERLAQVRDAWVAEQARHFARSHHREHLKARLYRRMGFGLAVLAVCLALSLFIIPYPHGHWPWCPSGEARAAQPADSNTAHSTAAEVHPAHSPASYPAHWLILLAGVLALVAGFAAAYSERRAFESLASQYDRMLTVFEHAKVEIDRHLSEQNFAAAQAAFEELGHEAITEHAQWLIARRSRPFELHIGG